MRIKGRKSKVDRRQPQRGGRFTSAQLAWMDRDQERLHRAREKERRRIANKKRQAEKEAKEREERRKQGIPDPHAMPVPSSQPLLSKFLAKPKTVESPSESPSVETPEFGDDDFEGRSDGGDTEVCSVDSYEAEIEAFDQRVMADEMAGRQYMVELTPGLLDRINKYGPPVDGYINNLQDLEEEVQNGPKDDEDAFSECSAFYDEDFIREAETVATAQGQGPRKTSQSLEAQPPQGQPAQPAVVEAYREAKPAQSQTQHTAAQPQPIPRPPAKPAIEESFRDDTADFLEQFCCDLGADGEFAPDEDFERELVQLNAG